MKDNLSFKVVQQKEKITTSSKNNTLKRNNLRKISVELKNNESTDNKGQKNFFPKFENHSMKQNNNINNNTNNNINNNINININNNINSINNNIINKNDNNTIINKANNNINNINNKNNINKTMTNQYNNNPTKNISPKSPNSQIKEESTKIPTIKANIAEEYKIKLDNIIKNDYEYQNLLPIIQKGSYLTGLPDSIYNNKNNSKVKGKYEENSKILKNLKEKEKSLNKEISSIKNKKQKLLNISLGNIGCSNIEKNVNNYEEKRLQSIENNLLEKLDEVKNQIKDIIQREKDLNKNKSSLIKNFLKKYENEENSENLAKKYYLKNNIHTDRNIIKLQKDCNIKNLNRFKNKEKSEYKLNQENEIKNEIEQKMIYLKEQNDKEKEIIKNRKKKIDEQMLKLKEKANTAECQPLQNYLFYKMENNFEQKEKLYLQNIKLTKKIDILGKEDLKILQEKYMEAKKEMEQKAIEKTISMKKCWHSRSLILPKYKSPMLKLIQENEKKKMEEEEQKLIKKNKFYEDKKNYFKDVVPLPKIDDKLRKDTIQKNFSLLNLHGKKRVNYIKEELNKINKIRIDSFNIEKKRFRQSNNLNKKYKYRITHINKNKSIEIEDKLKKINNNKKINGIELREKMNNSMEIKNNIKKIEIIKASPIKKRAKKNPKEINYLKDFENENKINKRYNWDKYIEEDEENKVLSILNVKNQIEALDNKAERKQYLLKIKGDLNNNQKIVNDINNLLINSIKGKLSIIKAINKEGEY